MELTVYQTLLGAARAVENQLSLTMDTSAFAVLSLLDHVISNVDMKGKECTNLVLDERHWHATITTADLDPTRTKRLENIA